VQELQSRIVGDGVESPEQMLANPRNWRIHPKSQQDSVEKALDDVGWVKRVIVNRTTGCVVDGHLRVALSISRGAEEIPVTYVELTEDEERAVLATFDPIADLAEKDDDLFEELVDSIGQGDGGDLLSGIGQQLDQGSKPRVEAPDRENSDTILAICPACGNEWDTPVPKR
jgi:hypothetical protein